MVGLTAIADEFPLLAAIADELGAADGGTKVAQLRTARRMLQDAFRALDHTPDIVGEVPEPSELRRCA